MNVAAFISKNQVLLSKYKQQYVAITDKIVGHDADYNTLIEKLKGTKEKFHVYYVPNHISKVRIYPMTGVSQKRRRLG